MTKIAHELHKTIKGLSPFQKQRLLDMKIISIEGSEFAAAEATKYVGKDELLKAQVTIIHGLSTESSVLEKVRALIADAGPNPYVLGPLTELLGSFSTGEGSEVIFRSLSTALPEMNPFPAPSRYATVGVLNRTRYISRG